MLYEDDCYRLVLDTDKNLHVFAKTFNGFTKQEDEIYEGKIDYLDDLWDLIDHLVDKIKSEDSNV